MIRLGSALIVLISVEILADNFCSSESAYADQPAITEQATVYFQPGRFGGWPANHGIWIWGNEIVVGFSTGYYQDRGVGFHAIDHDKPERHVLARSLDGGHTWSLEDPNRQGVLIGTKGMRHGTVPNDVHEAEPIDCPGNVEFTHLDFALTVRMADIHGGQSRFYYSLDRAHTWKGPFRLPLCGQKGIAARTDYVVNGPHDCLMFVTASKQNGKEGRPICIRTNDGARSWQFVSTIGPEPTGYAIMPATVRLSPTELLTTIRRREERPEESDAWIDAWLSPDNGQHWQFLNRAAPDLGEGNPPALVRLRDGRICLAYGVRKPPYRMEARLSSDGGRSWGQPFVLRTDGASRDLGYPRMVQRPDRKLVTIYYFHDRRRVERTIDATIWDPGS
ncbi:MAG TPA: sialidase family protein [Planctomycetaceae bacterium]|nr:sialidase family protein [Planctomycetaceae bacterium]